MRYRRSWLLLMAALALAACSKSQPAATDFTQDLPKTFSDAVGEVVSDPVRAQSIQNNAIKVGYAIDAYIEDAWKLHTRGFYLNANYETSAEDYEIFMEDLQDLRDKRQVQVIESMLQAREGVTPEEWEAIHDAVAAKLDMMLEN